MSIFKTIGADLREKRLWPVAVVLIVALIAIPLLLSKSAASTPPATPAGASGSGSSSPSSGLPVVQVDNSASHSKFTGKGRNPFNQLAASASGQSKTATSASTSSAGSGSSGAGTGASGAGTGSSGASTGSSGSTTPSSGTGSSTGGASGSSSSGGSGATTTSTTGSSTTNPGGSTTTTTTTARTTPTPPAPPPASGLSSSQSYQVSLAFSTDRGELDTVDSLERLSTVPAGQPLLVNLGVLKGGSRVLFAVLPGTRVRGPGRCAPGPVDCQVLSLGANQIERVSSRAGSTWTTFAVTAIGTAKHHSAAAARQARLRASANGRRLVRKASLSVLALFKFVPSLGAIVDMRDLKVGGK
jgi:hypothetical protein